MAQQLLNKGLSSGIRLVMGGVQPTQIDKEGDEESPEAAGQHSENPRSGGDGQRDNKRETGEPMGTQCLMKVFHNEAKALRRLHETDPQQAAEGLARFQVDVERLRERGVGRRRLLHN